MGGGVDTTIFAAFGVGMLSFFSPCVLPLVPGYLSAISGVAPARIGDAGARRMLGPALLFVLSFTAIFMALGLAATGLGQALTDNFMLLRKISGAAIMLLGVFLGASLLIPRINLEWRPELLTQRVGSGGPLIAGAAFAIAWTPCVGPTLGAILTAAGSKQHLGQGAVLLLFYSAGLAVPFIAAALGIGAMTGATNWIKRHYQLMIGISSVTLIVIGALIFTNEFYRLNVEAQRISQDLGLSF